MMIQNSQFFLQGYCTGFAIALHNIYGYEIYKVENKNTHYFCKVNKNGKELFIDVRGIAENPEYFLKPYNSTKEDIMHDNLSCYEDEYVEIAEEYAKSIIKYYDEYYKV